VYGAVSGGGAGALVGFRMAAADSQDAAHAAAGAAPPAARARRAAGLPHRCVCAAAPAPPRPAHSPGPCPARRAASAGPGPAAMPSSWPAAPSSAPRPAARAASPPSSPCACPPRGPGSGGCSCIPGPACSLGGSLEGPWPPGAPGRSLRRAPGAPRTRRHPLKWVLGLPHRSCAREALPWLSPRGGGWVRGSRRAFTACNESLKGNNVCQNVLGYYTSSEMTFRGDKKPSFPPVAHARGGGVVVPLTHLLGARRLLQAL
jgi:hypothetical protein